MQPPHRPRLTPYATIGGGIGSVGGGSGVGSGGGLGDGAGSGSTSGGRLSNMSSSTSVGNASHRPPKARQPRRVMFCFSDRRVAIESPCSASLDLLSRGVL